MILLILIMIIIINNNTQLITCHMSSYEDVESQIVYSRSSQAVLIYITQSSGSVDIIYPKLGE